MVSKKPTPKRLAAKKSATKQTAARKPAAKTAKRLPNPKMIEFLVCPITKTGLHYDRAKQELVSRAARKAFPIRQGVPMMVEIEARDLSEDDLRKLKN